MRAGEVRLDPGTTKNGQERKSVTTRGTALGSADQGSDRPSPTLRECCALDAGKLHPGQLEAVVKPPDANSRWLRPLPPHDQLREGIDVVIVRPVGNVVH